MCPVLVQHVGQRREFTALLLDRDRQEGTALVLRREPDRYDEQGERARGDPGRAASGYPSDE